MMIDGLDDAAGELLQDREEMLRLYLKAWITTDTLNGLLSVDFFPGDRKARTPLRQIAELVAAYRKTSGDTYPGVEQFKQLVDDALKTAGPERRGALEDEVAQILAVELPPNLTAVAERLGKKLRWIDLAGLRGLLGQNLSAGLEGIETAEQTLARYQQREVANGREPEARLETLGEAQARLGVEAEWVVDRMFAVGDMSVCVALPGTGKSYFNAQLMADVAQGTPFLGRKTRQGLVIGLLFEGARSTMNRMREFGVEADDEFVLVWTREGNSKDPLTWLKGVLGTVRPLLIVVDTLTDFSSIAAGASNGGYEETIGKLGPLLLWAMNNRVHIHFSHHANKANVDDITSALGTVGITGKPGTVLRYRKLDRADEASPRVLRGVKHREGRSVTEDLPPVVLEIDPKTQRLFESGTQVEVQTEINVRDIGAQMIRVVRQAVLSNPAGIRQFGDDGLLASVEGRKTSKLEALRLLTEPDGPLVMTGTAKSKTDPLMVALRSASAETVWRDRFTRRAPPSRDEEI